MTTDIAITPEVSLGLFRSLHLIRRTEETIVLHYPENEMTTPMHMSMGQEAVPTAVCSAVGPAAQVVCTYRTHAPFLARTTDVATLFGELYGRVNGSAEGKGGSMHLASPANGHLCSSAIVGAGLPIAAGAAFAAKRLGTGHIVTVFFGDGATEEGAFWETLNVCALMRLPVIFVCEDNGYAVETPPHVRQSFTSLSAVAQTFDLAYIHDDTNDVESLYTQAHRAATLVRETGKPVFFHARCYRYLEHVGIGCDLKEGYRSQEEFDFWRQRDCVALQRRRLIDKGFGTEVAAIETEIETVLLDAVATARASPAPAPDRLYYGVFHEAD